MPSLAFAPRVSASAWYARPEAPPASLPACCGGCASLRAKLGGRDRRIAGLIRELEERDRRIADLERADAEAVLAAETAIATATAATSSIALADAVATVTQRPSLVPASFASRASSPSPVISSPLSTTRITSGVASSSVDQIRADRGSEHLSPTTARTTERSTKACVQLQRFESRTIGEGKSTAMTTNEGVKKLEGAEFRGDNNAHADDRDDISIERKRKMMAIAIEGEATKRQCATVVTAGGTAPTTTTSSSSSSSSRRLFATPNDGTHFTEIARLVRAQIEIFSATPLDVRARAFIGGSKVPPSIGRVGIRCVHCARVPYSQRCKGSTSYPQSTRLVFQAVRNWQRHHLPNCTYIPGDVKARYESLKTGKPTRTGNAHAQWIHSCSRLGMVDLCDMNGIRFKDDDGVVPTVAAPAEDEFSTSRSATTSEASKEAKIAPSIPTKQQDPSEDSDSAHTPFCHAQSSKSFAQGIIPRALPKVNRIEFR